MSNQPTGESEQIADLSKRLATVRMMLKTDQINAAHYTKKPEYAKAVAYWQKRERTILAELEKLGD